MCIYNEFYIHNLYYAECLFSAFFIIALYCVCVSNVFAYQMRQPAGVCVCVSVCVGDAISCTKHRLEL